MERISAWPGAKREWWRLPLITSEAPVRYAPHGACALANFGDASALRVPPAVVRVQWSLRALFSDRLYYIGARQCVGDAAA